MSTESTIKPCDIAVVGMGSLFPGSKNKNEFWKDIYHGIDRITDIPSSHWDVEEYFSANPQERDKTYCKRGGFLPTLDFDPLSFGIPPNSLTATDTGQLLGLLVAKHTLDDVCEHKELNVSRERVSVILGTTGATELITDMASRLERPKWFKALLEEGIPKEQAERVCERVSSQYAEWQESTFPGLLSNVIAGRIANRLNLKGTNLVTDAACASSLAALQYAINELLLNQSDLVLTGGVDTLNTIFMYMCFSKTPALSTSGDCKPFSENSDGTLIGEGIGMIALKRLQDAEKAGDQIYAVIKGLGTSSDGLGKSIYAPLAEGQSRALRKTYAYANYSPSTVELVEAHGTGTKAGDLCELESLHSQFHSDKKRKWCAIGSVKSQIGHTKAAAGVAGLIKASLALQHKILPPTLKVSKPHKQIQDKNSPFYVNTQSKPWIRASSHPRRASVSSFGFGGSNFHLTLEEYTGPFAKKKARQFRSEAFFFSNTNVESLSKDLEKHLHISENFHSLADENQRSFQGQLPFRLAIVCKNLEELKDKIQMALKELRAKAISFSQKGIYYSSENKNAKLAILFPGQGSQYVGMSSELTMNFDSVRKTWDEIADFAIENSENKLHEIVFPQSAFSEEEKNEHIQTLQNTEWAQAAIASSSAALWNLVKSLGIQADYYSGHSLGSLTALYASGAYSLEDLVKIARRRGLLMSKNSEKESGMLAVSASAKQCEKVLSEIQSPVCIANINSQEQTVLSGVRSELEKVAKLLTQNKLSHRMIPVSRAFHSPEMKNIASQFAEFLKSLKVQPLKTPAISCLNANPYTEDTLVHNLVQELSSPVHFLSTIEELYNRGTRIFLEVGPKAVLSKLTRRILQGKDALILSLDEGEDSIFSLWNTLAQLAVAGLPMKLGKMCDEFLPPFKNAQQKSTFCVSVNGANLRPTKEVRKQPEKIATPIQEPVQERPKMDSRNHFDEKNSSALVSRLSLASQLQLEAARIHGEFQKSMSETHLAFLKSSERCFELLIRNEENETVELSQNLSIASPVFEKREEIKALPVQKENPLPEPVKAQEKVEPFKFSTLSAQEKTSEVPSVLPKEQGESAQASNSNFAKTLIDVISEKTGYPQELIKIEMSLDTDLGIDSIKRVEIFSQLAEKVPQAASIDPQSMNKLITLQNILDYLEAQSPEASPLPKKKFQDSLPLNASL